MIAANANGSLTHYHTTSGKQLNQILGDGINNLLCCDYKPDGHSFVTGGKDGIIRLYDEQTRKLVKELKGGTNGQPGHTNRVFCSKFV